MAHKSRQHVPLQNGNKRRVHDQMVRGLWADIRTRVAAQQDVHDLYSRQRVAAQMATLWNNGASFSQNNGRAKSRLRSVSVSIYSNIRHMRRSLSRKFENSWHFMSGVQYGCV